MRKKALVACCAASLAFVTSGAALAAVAWVKDGQAVIGNESLERRLSLEGGMLRTVALVNRLAKTELAVKSDEFALRINDAQELTAADLRVVSHKVEDLPRSGKRLSFLLENRALGLEARVGYEVAADDFFMRKRLALRTTGAEASAARRINWVEVERFTAESQSDLGGMGQPVFLGQCIFLGLEYPAASNSAKGNAVALRHNPGRRLTGEFWDAKPAVLGVSAAGQVESAFARYVSLIRIPPRTHNLYNSWYDVRQRDMSKDAFLAVFDGFKKNLYDKHGLKLDSFVIDDGWQDHDSIWGINVKLFPDGFGGLVDGLQAAKTDLGLWLPLTAVKGNLNTEWGKANGYEVADTRSHYCLSGPNYNRKLREVLADYIRRYKVAYFKHDFNSFSCAADGHGHLPSREYGFEANVDAYIEMLKFTRSLNPNIFLNVTGGMWLSPWWLMSADTVWRGAGDFGYEKSVPAIEQRDWHITYIDAVLYDNFRVRRCQFPPSALMTHGIIYGKLCMLGGKDEPLDKWTDHVVSYLGPGVMMKEIYITPSILTEQQWAILAQALRWAEENKDILANGEMIGGNPRLGEVYGYRHALGSRTIYFLRNPSMKPQKVKLALAGEGTPKRLEVIYPYRRVLANAVTSAEVEVGSYELLVIEGSAGEAASAWPPEGLRHSHVGGKPGEWGFETYGAPGEPVRVVDASAADDGLKSRARILVPAGGEGSKFFVLWEKIAKAAPAPTFTVNGSDAKPRVVDGERWKAFVFALTPGEWDITCAIPSTERPTAPFAAKSFLASSWLLAKDRLPSQRVTVARFDPKQLLPTPLAAVQTRCLAVHPAREVSPVKDKDAKITAEQLKSIKAAKLHVQVFGANREAQYARKPMRLNGQEIGILPASSDPIDTWQEKVFDIPKDKLSLVAAANTLVVANAGGDSFKLSDIGLAVQLPDGTWVESNRDAEVYCSTAGWLYSEGKTFGAGGLSPNIRLVLTVEG